MAGKLVVVFVMGLITGLTGCASHSSRITMQPEMKFPASLPEGCLRACHRLWLSPTRAALVVRVGTQSAALYVDERLARAFPCSTSPYGVGQTEGSYCTPLGLHCVAEKFGAGEPPGTVFQNRQIIGHTSEPRFAQAKMTTRILWLEGLDPGFNRGGNVDSHQRYIYIHGTSQQAGIGHQLMGFGCIHLTDPDLIALFDELPSGSLVWIQR